MTTSHWLQSRISSTGFLRNIGLLALPSVTIPAGGRLVRFVVNECAIHGTVSARGVNVVDNYTLSIAVRISSGAYSPRYIYQSLYRIPSAYTALYDPATLERIYSQWLNIGDAEVGTSRRTSYGGTGKAAFTLATEVRIDSETPGSNAPTGQTNVGVAYLYDL